MPKSVIAQKGPFAIEVQAGRRNLWGCGRGRKQPLCDGSPKATSFKPVVFTAEKSETVYLCGCKHTGDRPFCDDTHETL